jgi:hypothetical protein
MATTYCSVEDVSDFLRVPITATTTPNKTQVEKIIRRKEDEIDRRMGHAWRSVKIYNERHDLPLLYTFGWGTPLWLQHRNIYDFNAAEGDKIEIWQGASDTYDNILGDAQWYNMDYQYGRLYLRGFIFSILRKNRVRISYRYGGEKYSGDTTIPNDIEDITIKLTAIDLLTTSFRMDRLPVGGNSMSWGDMIKAWKEDIEQCILNRREVMIIP